MHLCLLYENYAITQRTNIKTGAGWPKYRPYDVTELESRMDILSFKKSLGSNVISITRVEPNLSIGEYQGVLRHLLANGYYLEILQPDDQPELIEALESLDIAYRTTIPGERQQLDNTPFQSSHHRVRHEVWAARRSALDLNKADSVQRAYKIFKRGGFKGRNLDFEAHIEQYLKTPHKPTSSLTKSTVKRPPEAIMVLNLAMAYHQKYFGGERWPALEQALLQYRDITERPRGGDYVRPRTSIFTYMNNLRDRWSEGEAIASGYINSGTSGYINSGRRIPQVIYQYYLKHKIYNKALYDCATYEMHLTGNKAIYNTMYAYVKLFGGQPAQTSNPEPSNN